MSTPVLLLVVILIAGFFVMAFLITIYNGLINKRVESENSWSQVDVQLKLRYDLIPNLVETVKGYASHEKDTLEKVSPARNLAMNARGVAQQSEAEVIKVLHHKLAGIGLDHRQPFFVTEVAKLSSWSKHLDQRS